MHPLFPTSDAIARGELEVVLPAYPPAPLDIQAVYLTRRHLSAKVRSFVDFLADNMALPEHGIVLK